MTLREIRKGKHMTQKQLAAAAGVTQKVLSHYETGRRKPSIKVAVLIGRALGLSYVNSISLFYGDDVIIPRWR